MTSDFARFANISNEMAAGRLRPATNSSLVLDGHNWPIPKPLPSGLLAVANFDPATIPDVLAPWVMDIADRMQCPPDFVAVPAVLSVGALVGRQIAIRPKQKTDWYEVPNLWGMIVGRPGAMKSPAMTEALKLLSRLEAEARKQYELEARKHAIEAEAFKLTKDEATKKARKAIQNGSSALSYLDVPEPELPVMRRYIANDTTYEKLGEILAENPNGILGYRDEILSLLKTLDREEQVSARGFFLSGWNGTSGYTFDRIIRGQTHIEAVCLSVLGSTQPSRLAAYMRKALRSSDDGLIQRFSLMVWPDQSPEWRNVDRFPDSEARARAWKTFADLNELTAEAIGAERDDHQPLPFLRFDPLAQALFDEWHANLESVVRSGKEEPALESHLAKYRKLVPALALINHLCAERQGPVSERALLKALAFAEYLETHARRVYGSGSEAEAATAKAILSRMRSRELEDGFTARDVYRRQWSNLSDRESVQAGLDLLVDHDWLKAAPVETGGRAKTNYQINPGAFQ